MNILAIISALSVGVSLGLLGGGGSILTLPILVYLLDVAPKTAIPVSLLIVGLGALSGALRHYHKGNVDLKAAAAFLPAALVGAWLGGKLGTLVPALFQMLLFGTITILAALSMLRPSGIKKAQTRHFLVLSSSAFGVGLLTGLIGVGGGFLIVPTLVFFAGLSMTHAIGTSLLVIALNSFVGFAAYWGIVSIPWSFTLFFALVVSVGIFIGVKVSDHVDEKRLKKLFALMLILVGVFILYKNLGQL